MKLSEILKQETAAKTSVYLYREGLFWKAYEYSAYTFTLFFRPYRPQKKWFKGIAREVVSLGFPDSKLAEITEGHETEKPDEKVIEIKGTPLVDEEAFVEWKSALSLADTDLPAATPADGNMADSATMDNLLARLAAFRVESATPVQCMLFITELQKELHP